jgi:hypothetical protein
VADEERGPVEAVGETESGAWPYVGVGCLTAIVGLVAGGMIAVLIAKMVGAAHGCAPDAETGAPCNWNLYWTWGARLGFIGVPTFVIWRMHRVRSASRNSDRGNRSGTR